ncbi:MAG: hypothetical protein KGD57_06620 [Candidatus Lokiarchaeota archaeon]|nr:hypothetical protein [Candidatus Lokiarchaeota archaeon]
MPVGLVLMKWDERVGTDILAKFPEEITINDKTLMQVYSTHEYGGESGMISLMIGSLNIASYFTGPDTGYYILLLLNVDEDPDAYEGGLADVARTILLNLEDDKYRKLVPTLFRRLSVYPTFREEQKLAMTYEEEIKRMIIHRLRDEGVVSKSELGVWLRDRYKQGFVDLESVLIELIKQDIIREASVKGMPSELLFLTNDLIMMRIPPEKLIDNPSEKGLPEQLSDDYIIECRKFFQNYRPTEEDNLKIINLLIDPEVYETIRLLRTAIVTRNELEKLKKKGVDNVSDVLKKLWDNQMIQVFQDEHNNEYYALLSDFYLDKIFPKYILNVIKKEYEQKSKADKVLAEYLTVLENAFIDQKSVAKIEE